ncbi:hypothetical protein Godav_007696 [Gossypium davidsonii]|nr:hypothetical protein [Gossypium davidsonii]
MEELNHVIGLTIIDGYGLGEKREWLMKDYQLRRVMKYSAPPSGEYTNVVSAHTDKLCSALLCEDGISGLEIETKDGEWVKLCMPPGTFVFIYGDLLNAWSNGRMHAVNHRVMLRRNEYRYSLGTFAVPVKGTIIKAAKEMVDEEHPRVFKDTDFMDSEAVLICCSTQKLS